jgi:lipoprotein-anchoring transpeptidase ErfK/SrfK
LYAQASVFYPDMRMKQRLRDAIVFAVAIAAVIAVAFGGYAVVRARASGAPARQSLAPVPLPTSTGGTAPAQPTYPRWVVGKAVGPVTVYRRPDTGAPVVAHLGKLNQNGYPTLVLVDSRRQVGSTVWSRVWVAVRPNGTRGWVREGQLSFYTTTAKIVIDLSQRRLYVYVRAELRGAYPVAVGQPGLATPSGFFFVNQKLKPPSPGGPYGVLALGISAFQPKLSYWPQGGAVAIHGTNEDQLIGKPISHGCVRMHNKDILAVNRLVPAGSPVEIRK